MIMVMDVLSFRALGLPFSGTLRTVPFPLWLRRQSNALEMEPLNGTLYVQGEVDIRCEQSGRTCAEEQQCKHDSPPRYHSRSSPQKTPGCRDSRSAHWDPGAGCSGLAWAGGRGQAAEQTSLWMPCGEQTTHTAHPTRRTKYTHFFLVLIFLRGSLLPEAPPPIPPTVPVVLFSRERPATAGGESSCSRGFSSCVRGLLAALLFLLLGCFSPPPSACSTTTTQREAAMSHSASCTVASYPGVLVVAPPGTSYLHSCAHSRGLSPLPLWW